MSPLGREMEHEVQLRTRVVPRMPGHRAGRSGLGPGATRDGELAVLEAVEERALHRDRAVREDVGPGALPGQPGVGAEAGPLVASYDGLVRRVVQVVPEREEVTQRIAGLAD